MAAAAREAAAAAERLAQSAEADEELVLGEWRCHSDMSDTRLRTLAPKSWRRSSLALALMRTANCERALYM